MRNMAGQVSLDFKLTIYHQAFEKVYFFSSVIFNSSIRGGGII